MYDRYTDLLMDKCVLATTMRTVSQTSEGVAITTLVNSVSLTGSIMTTRLTNEETTVKTQEESELTDPVPDADYTTMESLQPDCK